MKYKRLSLCLVPLCSVIVTVIAISFYLSTASTPVKAQRIKSVSSDVLISAKDVRVERFVPLDQLNQHNEISVRMGGLAESPPIALAPQVVDPLSIYSNVTGFSGSAFAQGAASGGITRMVMDDLTFSTNPNVGTVTTIRFAVANLNATAQSVRARVRFWNADGAPLGAGLPNGPGTYYSPGGTAVGFSFAAFSFAPGVTTLTGNLTAPGFSVPAGTTTTLWAGLTFDNVGTTTGATDTELSNFGQGLFNPVDKGLSKNTLFETTAAGSFFGTNAPPGAAFNLGGNPIANMGWEFVVTSLGTTAANVEVSGRVLTGEGRGLRNSLVTLTDQNGNSRSTMTGPLGSYRFNEVEAGQTYVVRVLSRRFTFSPRVIQIVDSIADLDFIAGQ